MTTTVHMEKSARMIAALAAVFCAASLSAETYTVANGGSSARRRAVSAVSCSGVICGTFAAAARAASCRRSSGASAAVCAVTSSRNMRFLFSVERSIHCAAAPSMWSYTVSFTCAFAATFSPSTQTTRRPKRSSAPAWPRTVPRPSGTPTSSGCARAAARP